MYKLEGLSWEKGFSAFSLERMSALELNKKVPYDLNQRITFYDYYVSNNYLVHVRNPYLP